MTVTTTSRADRKNDWLLATALFAGAAVYRILVGLHPFSGQGNHHGGQHGTTAAYGGDFEAQRHWMELTWNLKHGIGSWYWYDLPYWGLDYPPLTAYVSYVCGALSHYLVGPETVALVQSRGYEGHKSFMRATVLVTDLAIYGTAIWAWSQRHRQQQQQPPDEHRRLYHRIAAFVIPMLHPAIVLIDHGHFQYNTTALGLCLWCFYYLTQSSNNDNNRYYAAIFFCLALNFKQMTLYYAPAVFFFLLGDCFARQGRPVQNVAMLGVIVVAVFVILWLPFVLYGPDTIVTSPMDRLWHVLRRIFPFHRGLFEGKVANLWCAMSVRPFRIRDWLPAKLQPMAALLLTALAMLPSCLRMFQLGVSSSSSSRQKQFDSSQQLHQQQQTTASLLLWGMTSCSLAFFLASFQVHEKSLIMALAPASLLLVTPVHDDDQQLFLQWFAIFGTWTLWPLLTIDRLQTAYFCTLLMFAVALTLQDELLLRFNTTTNNNTNNTKPVTWYGMFWKLSRIGFYGLAVLLHVLELVVTPPKHLPDLFPVLWSVVGCAGLSMAYLYTISQLFYSTTLPSKAKIQ